MKDGLSSTKELFARMTLQSLGVRTVWFDSDDSHMTGVMGRNTAYRLLHERGYKWHEKQQCWYQNVAVSTDDIPF